MMTRSASLTAAQGARSARWRRGREPARSVDPAGSPAWPLAVGVVLVPAEFTGRNLTEDRLMLALGAYQIGYFLLDLIDVPAWASADEARAWAPVWDLVLRAQADAVVVHGRQDRRVPKPPVALRRLAIRILKPEG